MFEKVSEDVVKFKKHNVISSDVSKSLPEKAKQTAGVKRKKILILIQILMKKKKMQNSLKSKAGKLGRQSHKWSETLRIKQIGLVDFRSLFYNCQCRAHLTYKSDRCSLGYLDPCAHMGHCGRLS